LDFRADPKKLENHQSPFFWGPGVRFVFFSHTPSEKERTPKKRKKKKKENKRKNGPR
jgi:hypothetical protein